MKQNKKEELQSRRQFFKNAAKGALPILGAIALANMPILAKAAEPQTDCRYGCSTSCLSSCRGSCQTTCSGSCSGSCLYGCSTNCKGSCTGGCSYGCGHSSR